MSRTDEIPQFGTFGSDDFRLWNFERPTVQRLDFLHKGWDDGKGRLKDLDLELVRTSLDRNSVIERHRDWPACDQQYV